MINFNAKKYDGVSSNSTGLKEILKVRTEAIEKDLLENKTNFFSLGAHLIDLYSSNAYAVVECNREQVRADYKLPIGAGNCCSAYFFAYCFEKFGMDKSQVSRCMNIVDEFGDGLRGFKKSWDKFSYSQLAELLPLSDEQRKPVKPTWTVKQIRDYKKTLVATPQEETEESPQTEEPPSKYARFDKWTKNELCDKIFELEAEREILLNEIEALREVAAQSAA